MKEKSIYHFNIKQGTPEWFAIRDLKLTASKADIIATNGKGLDTLVTELLAEHYSSQQYDEYTDKFKNSSMQRGNDFEPIARMVYEFETGNQVKEVGCVTVGKYILASPDGLVTEKGKDEGLIEIKNHSDKVFLELILTGRVDTKYIKQMQYQMWTTNRKWCDYFGYNPNFKPSFYLKRFYPDEEMFAKFEAGVKAGSAMLDAGLKMLEGKLVEQQKHIEEVICPELANIKQDMNEFFEKTATKPVADINKDDFPF